MNKKKKKNNHINWYYNPWLITIAGGIIVTVTGYILFGNSKGSNQPIQQFHSGTGDNVAGNKTTIIHPKKLFSDTQSIKTLPLSMGGKDILNLDNIGTLKQNIYSYESITLLLNVVSFEDTPINNKYLKAEGREDYSYKSDQKYFFDRLNNKSHKITIENRTFVVTLKKIKRLELPNVSNPLEYEFIISEVMPENP